MGQVSFSRAPLNQEVPIPEIMWAKNGKPSGQGLVLACPDLPMSASTSNVRSCGQSRRLRAQGKGGRIGARARVRTLLRLTEPRSER